MGAANLPRIPGREELVKAGLQSSAAEILVNLFTSYSQALAASVTRWPGVLGEYGVTAFPSSAARGSIGAGMLVRTTMAGVQPASSDSGDARIWANAFVLAVDEKSGTIWTAAGATRAPLVVLSPVAGQKVSVLRGGAGTCDTISGSGDLQPVATCEVSVRTTAGLCMCSMIAFQTPLNQSLGTRYWATDGSSSPSTGPWQLGGSSLANQNFWITTLLGGNPYAGAWFQAQGGADSIANAIIGGTGDPDDDSTWDFTEAFLFSLGGNLVRSGNADFSNYTAFAFTAPTGARTQTFQNATGTIPLLEVAQTWTQAQTSSVAKNYAYSAASLIGLYDVGVVFGGTLEYVTATTALNAVFLVPLPAGTVWTALSVKARRAAVGSGVTVSVTKRSATGSTVTLTVVDGPDTFSPVGVTTNTMTFASPETVAADTIYQIEVVFGASGGHLYDFEFITSSQPFA